MFGDVTTLADDIQLVQDLVAWSDLKPAQIAARIGKPNTTINRFANGKAEYRMSRETLAALRAEFPSFPGFAEMPEANGAPFKMEGASVERMREDLPVFGTALGAARQVDGEAIEQTTLNRAEVVQYAKRPVLLNGRADAYGLFVSGSSMEPRHLDGETVLVDPKGRVKNGEDVVVYLRPNEAEADDGETARAVLIKRLVKRTSTYYELEQYSPALVFRIPMEDVVRVDRVIPWSELLS
jgi:hypothetical protein